MLDLGSFRDRLTNLGVETDSDLYHALCDAVVALSYWNLSESDQITALNTISEYGLSKMTSTPIIPDDAWVPFDYGNVRPGEYVKVAPDAYSSDTGAKHNGRLGVVTEVSGHRASVRYITDPSHSLMRHPIDRLLSLKYVVKYDVYNK